MKSVVRLLAVVAFGLLAFAAPSSAQYVFLDSNGDAAHTASDQLNANGVATPVSLYVITDKNRDGGTATCNTADGELTINSYGISIQATGGTVTFTGWANAQAGMATVLQAITSNTTDLTAGFGGGTINPPGKYLLMTGTITGTAGAPSINIIADSPLSTGSGTTQFGTACSGNDFDNTYKLIGTNTGTGDFTDVDGLGAAPGGNLDPTITAPATASGTENSAFSVTASASDPEAANVTLSQTNNAAFLTGPASAGPSTTPSITLTGTPDFTQAGSYTVNWSAADATTGAATASTAITIANLNRNPVITVPATVSGSENSAVSVTASSSDPDAENVGLSQTNNATFLAGPATAGPSANPSITLSGTPTFAQSGSYTVNWNASAGAGGSATAATAITIANVNRLPAITAPATISHAEGDTLSATASASDADGQTITLSQTNNAPFLTGPASVGPVANPSLSLVGTPDFSQAGSYTVDWSAVDASAGTSTAGTAITISNVNQNPAITAPVTASGSENSAVSIVGSASDPDANNVTLSQTNNAAFLAGPASSGPSANPSITLTGTPDFTQAGSYTVNWGANDGAGGTATAGTALTIANTNRNPAITAPATVSGATGAVVSATGSASDPDAQDVTLSQTNNAPFFTASSSNGPSATPSITLSGTPTVAQAGSFTINWAANDGAGGTATATTALTITTGNLSPVITAPATESGAENSAVSITGAASDPDANLVALSQTNDAAFLAGPASVGPVLNPSLTVSGTPSFTEVGTYTINWSALDNGTPPLTSTATTTLMIANTNQNPSITAPATVGGTENAAASITASASDPDAENMTLSQTNNAAFLTGPASAGPSTAPSITLTGTPNFSQAGSYTVNWSVVDISAGTATATTALTITNVNRNPAITAPATAGGSENVPVSIVGSASDPDADNVTLSQTNNAAFLAGAASAGPSANPSITLAGTPDLTQAGSYTINWSAADATTGTASATTALTIGEFNQIPVITAPATVAGTENAATSIIGSASDPDAENVTLSQTNNAAFLAGPASAGPSANPSIPLAGTPSFSQAGSYTINWSAVDAAAGTATATTALTIADVNRNTAITAPATASGSENSAVSIVGSASDPDAENVTLTQTNDAAFLAGPASDGPSAAPSITLAGTPNFSQAGSYTVNWSAADATTGTATASTALTISNVNRNPAITAPATTSGTEGLTVFITGSASDPDGDDVTLSQTNNAAFLTGAASAGPALNPGISLSGTPGLSDAGSYTVNWSAADATTGTATATTALTIGNFNSAPILDQPADMTVNEGATATQQLVGNDPDSDPLTYSKVGTTPFFMSVSAAGLVTLAPGFTDAGSFTGTARVSDGTANDTKSFSITVQNVNRCPVANAGGPYTGVIGFAVNFSGTASSDADGDALTYSWDFGDGGSLGNGASPQHTYATAGTYTVTLTADDGTCSDTATTTASIVAEFPAAAFTTGGNNTTSLGAGKPTTCVQIEPVGGSFTISDVDLTTIKMISVGTGSVAEISADTGKTTVDGDKNSNGVSEIRACFTKADLRLLFSGLPAGRNTVTVALEGDLTTGGKFRGTLIHTVKSTGAALAATVSPNPLNPETTLSFQLRTPGRVTVKIFDLNGRLVKTLLDDTRGAGYQDLTWNGTNHGGAKVASGVYYFRLDTPDGRIVKAATVLK